VAQAWVSRFVVISHAVAVAGTRDHSVETACVERKGDGVAYERPVISSRPFGLDLDTDGPIRQPMDRAHPGEWIEDPQVRVSA
jgi:hypothetical protein